MTTESSIKRRSGLYLLIAMGVWSLFFLLQQRDTLLRFTSSSQQVTTTTNYIRNMDTVKETVHVLFGLNGNDAAFLAEFQVALKSVLLHAPIDQPMHIHIMTDEEAYQAVTVSDASFKDNPLHAFVPSLQWQSIQPIQIHVYNVQQLIEHTWTSFLTQQFQSWSFEQVMGRYSVGAFFRLLAHQVLLKHDPTIDYVIYLDPDVVFLANIQALWKERPLENPQILFAWGASMCSGFLLLNVKRLDALWELTGTLDLVQFAEQKKLPPNDQLLFRAINITHPENVALLSPAWDVNIADGIWRYAKNITQQRPHMGMMHFNGGPHDSAEPYYKVHHFLTDPKLVETWGVALYYARMPWTWARYQAESQIPGNRPSYPLEVYLYPSSCLAGNCASIS